MTELDAISHRSGPVMDRGEGAQKVGRGLGSALVPGAAAVPAGPPHCRLGDPVQAPVDALIDRLDGDAADQVRSAGGRVPGLEVAADLLSQCGLVNQAVAPTWLELLSAVLGLGGPVAGPSSVVSTSCCTVERCRSSVHPSTDQATAGSSARERLLSSRSMTDRSV